MKRFVVWTMALACFLFVLSPFQAAAASSKVNIVVNGETLKLDVAPYIQEGRVLVPVRGVFENLGLEVSWKQSTKTATIKNEKTVISMKLGKKTVQVNDKDTKVDSAVSMKDNRMFIPLRFVAENSGAKVDWNKVTKTVKITANQLDEETIAFLNELAQVELNSFSADMNIQQSMKFMGQEVNADMDMKMDMVLDPFGFYQSMSMKMDELGEEAITMESYLTKDGYFSYDSMSDQWVKYDDEMADELTGLSDLQMDPTAQFELIQKYYQDVKVIENEDTYELHASLSGSGFQGLLDEVLNLSELGLEEDLLEGLDIKINKMNIVSILDKETLHPISDTMESDMTIVMEGEKMQIVQKAENTYSNVNKLEKITIPQEVIKNAVPFEELN